MAASVVFPVRWISAVTARVVALASVVCSDLAVRARAAVSTLPPDMAHVSTSYTERSNLTLRMGRQRFTRLTKAFSKKVENHAHAVALHMMHYNFARIHKTLRVTPAIQAGVTDHVWSLEEIAALAP